MVRVVEFISVRYCFWCSVEELKWVGGGFEKKVIFSWRVFGGDDGVEGGLGCF